METRRKSIGEVGMLVDEVLASLQRPWSKHITRRISDAVKENPTWRSRYDELVSMHGRAAVNRQIGRSTLQLTGLRNLRKREKAQDSLVDTYTLLG